MAKRKKTHSASQSSHSVASVAASVISQVASKAKSAAKKVKTGVSGFINRRKSRSSQGAHLLSFFS
jgi:hypothetical protein